ncbi:MAG: hypothetical protein QM607_10425 [Microbacterium sp.]
MPRRRPRNSDEHPSLDVERLRAGWRRTESRRGRLYSVQPMAQGRSEKSYVCPACDGVISPGEAHVVVWREDGVLGDQADLSNRRHWHTHCWSIA